MWFFWQFIKNYPFEWAFISKAFISINLCFLCIPYNSFDKLLLEGSFVKTDDENFHLYQNNIEFDSIAKDQETKDYK